MKGSLARRVLPILIGLLGAGFLVLLCLGIVTWAQGWAHAVELLSQDRAFVAALVVLRDDSGRVAEVLGWEPLSNDSHHRSGLLYFDDTASFATGRQYMELSLRNVGGVPERVLRWDLPLTSR